jgi:hypothetical protein
MSHSEEHLIIAFSQVFLTFLPEAVDVKKRTTHHNYQHINPLLPPPYSD